MTSITHAELGWNEVGTPVSDQFDDVYFSNVNGLEETRYVFLKQNLIPERWQEFDRRRFVIGETGFGTGLNFLAVWQAFNDFRRANPDATLKELHFVSFEKFPLSKQDLIKAHQAWPELAELAEKLHRHYPPAVPECHRIVLDNGAVTLDLWLGDIKDCLPSVPYGEEGIIDTWFLDGFAPSKNPEMWNQDLFNGMAKLARSECRVATFTSAGFVRRGLIEAGFAMKKVKGFGTKREMIAGCMETRQPQSRHAPYFNRTSASHLDSIAIIGGGIASAALAKALVQRGQKVTLYCKHAQAAEGASGNRQGAVYPLLNGSHDGVSRVFAPAFLFARQFVEQAAQALTFDHDWCGVTQLMWDEKSTNKLDKMLAGNFAPELIQKLSVEETAAKIGLPIDMASVHYPLGGWLCPAELTQALFAQLGTLDNFTAKFEQSVEQLIWDEMSQHWQVHTQGQHDTYSAVVIANGHEFQTFSQTADIPLGQVKGQVSHAPATETLSKLKSVLCYDGYMTPVNPNNQHLCIGASYDRRHLDTEFDVNAQQENAERLTQCVPNQAWAKEVDTSGNLSRQGIRCVSRDHLPFVGNVGDFSAIKRQYADLPHTQAEDIEVISQFPNLFCLLGLGSRGLSSAPLMAELLASQICNDPLPLPVDVLEELHPSRMWVRKLRKGKAITEL
ncbi:TPA: bifunctional tRNA (5-methylaminomethyl-2-thiouridine)(34)-methyltransferase MnmD/FAD-dependent 5-carboxymethylaminomethyl-2-thiouridine(34) oxidoreductase MnmC [Vibrio vulnificus]|uniref:bifunctional tRNA (5-methylaminomethyl-2-thiouridine)(34)-methyltransferase MnmD/FAD-dependent 5-carboxymethylaminomethyl-2-thiouridine(34) oxidoreductase MnmC n=1 Tax=Vibrio vulnificus TaxID=672 RepID=UPI001023E2D5|nr:bifunctional tRNA (5-methylaminomethyl-2-thiouridine)(34)-methyltransferase MnmD/FAD-dependent 5-carboxymethylaminomethyl-2-thiouridine(34) oxidoreductase MnmC [Vibrio vulnificus]EKY4882782.1 bifunctional tRNA (5-methylaminomethyl-2-thiouridine)(34)-methyltransferase MnmD/FAD-dependent 5-carboxymethylaminomethyl-2-thiouridine(34) oxidoreductase MnmC [Vibrio vulnificus]ELE1907077.1 bifunctional tRNA (5-methylaminomethyl-2-thiouridine)(34)-methyltransferase MnmD/FAD-dependent 5-carboxymethylamin